MIELPSHVPLFPLPNVVLFPQMPVALHVFEPRYRKMVADVRSGENALIGLVLLRPGWEPVYDGRPPIFPVGCAGRIEQLEALPDGRSNLVLRGLTRFTVVGETTGRPYRIGRVQARPERPGEATALEALRARLIATMERATRQAVVVLDGQLPPETLINALSQSLELAAIERQSLLDCDTVLDRGQRLLEILEWKRLEGRSGGHSRVH